jgi:hypothetical protein
METTEHLLIKVDNNHCLPNAATLAEIISYSVATVSAKLLVEQMVERMTAVIVAAEDRASNFRITSTADSRLV